MHSGIINTDKLSKRILILANSDIGLYNFRKELLIRLIDENHQVYISVPPGIRCDEIEDLGCVIVDTFIDRRGTNLKSDLKLFLEYIKIIFKIKPDLVLSYTIKPNIYGGLACRLLNINNITNITGLGSALQNEGKVRTFLLRLYKISLTKSKYVFFQNIANRQFFKDNQLAEKADKVLIPGSGVNIDNHQVLPYPQKKTTEFVFIARVMRDKGIEEYFEAVKYIKNRYTDVVFHICGSCEEDYLEQIEEMVDMKMLIYHGMVKDIREIHKQTHCVVNPSYHEGMSNVLLEAAAAARPILASDIPGCKETFDNNVSGIGFQSRSANSLIEAIELFLSLPYDEQKEMGQKGRVKMEKEFNRNIIVDSYIDKINRL